MKLHTLIPSIAALAFIAPVFAGEGWLTDLDAAKKKAAEENKMIFMEFTGSDWCPPCMSLKKNVLSTPEFLDAAQKDFVLVEFDFPRKKEIAGELKKKNQAESEKYQVKGFPTIIFADAQGRPVKVAVGGSDKDSFLKEMSDAVKQGAELAAALKKAESAQGDEKVTALAEVLKIAPDGYTEGFYSDIEEQLKKNDVNDKTGIKAAKEKAAKLQAQEQDLMKVLSSAPHGDLSKVETMLVDYLKKDELMPETKQKVTFILSEVILDNGRFDEAITKMEESLQLAPSSKMTDQIARQKEILVENRDKILKMIEDRKKAKEAPSK